MLFINVYLRKDDAVVNTQDRGRLISLCGESSEEGQLAARFNVTYCDLASLCPSLGPWLCICNLHTKFQKHAFCLKIIVVFYPITLETLN